VAPSADDEVICAKCGKPQVHKDDGKKQEVCSCIKIVRATTRFQIDLTSLSPKAPPGAKRPLSPAEKALRDALQDVAVLATTARNVAMRANYGADSKSLDDYLLEHGEMPRKSADWCTTKLYSYPKIRAAVPRLSSNIAATLQREIDRKWSQVRFDVLIRQIDSCPHFRVGQPVPVPASSLRMRKREDGALVLSFSLYSGAHDGVKSVEVPMIARDDHQRELLEKIATGEYKYGQAMIERDRLRPSRWYLRLAYTRKVPKRTEGIVAGVHRGIKTFLCAVTADGEQWLYDGYDIEAYLKQVQRRRRRIQNSVVASARVGHGRRRVLTPISHLQDKAARWRATRCQVIARRLAQWLSDRNVRRVYLDDFVGIRNGLPEQLEGGQTTWQRIQEWPFYEMQMRLIACLQEYGIETVVRPAAYISQRCPRCGHVAQENVDLKFWCVRCTKCRFKKHLDISAGMNLIASGEAASKGEPSDFLRMQEKIEEVRRGARRASRKSTKSKEADARGRKA
jgi:ssDNA-binding Zn-finger/Zn-ribbon topoisomerase 1